jgi:hypothetical protein
MRTSELHIDILPEQQRTLFELLAQQSWIEPFYLAGGTALALYIGHRQSIDFDFFTRHDFQNRDLIEHLRSIGTFELFSEAQYTINGLVNEVRISFFRYPAPLLHTLLSYHRMTIANMLDIALMKLEAISGRGSKKDFIDLYFLLREFSLGQLFEGYQAKYGIAVSNHYHLLKSLAYFEDAESQPMPVMTTAISWKTIKEEIIAKIKTLKLG